jgi:hypothetical protein
MKKKLNLVLAILMLTSFTLAAQGVKIKMSFSEKDSVRTVNCLITKAGEDGVQAPMKGVDVKVYVKRAFSLLPVEGENLTTDESGMASVEFPNDIPGDAEGKLTVIAKVEDNDEAGELEASEAVKWGTVLLPDESFSRRALWQNAANAPLPLVIFVTSMVALVWGVIIYIVYLMFVINKAGKQQLALKH